MFKCRLSGFNVTINLDNGVWILPDESGVGKTYMFNILKKSRTNGALCFAYTYDDFVNGYSPVENLINPDIRVCMFDRYDIYSDHFCKEIDEAGKSKIILVDSKGVFPFQHCMACNLDRDEHAIEVW